MLRRLAAFLARPFQPPAALSSPNLHHYAEADLLKTGRFTKGFLRDLERYGFVKRTHERQILANGQRGAIRRAVEFLPKFTNCSSRGEVEEILQREKTVKKFSGANQPSS